MKIKTSKLTIDVTEREDSPHFVVDAGFTTGNSTIMKMAYADTLKEAVKKLADKWL
jgi:hypothetical protein